MAARKKERQPESFETRKINALILIVTSWDAGGLSPPSGKRLIRLVSNYRLLIQESCLFYHV